jgi:hypothetical protein
MPDDLKHHATLIIEQAQILAASDTSTLDRLQAKCISRIYQQAEELTAIADNNPQTPLASLDAIQVEAIHETLTPVQGYAQMLKNMRAEHLSDDQVQSLQTIIQSVHLLCDRLDIVITQQESDAHTL